VTSLPEFRFTLLISLSGQLEKVERRCAAVEVMAWGVVFPKIPGAWDFSRRW